MQIGTSGLHEGSLCKAKGEDKMKKTVYECACGQQRKESNHWFLLFHYEGFITLHKWRDDLVDSPNAEHICGPGCLAKAIDAWANPTWTPL